jgi:hypothetical protein
MPIGHPRTMPGLRRRIGRDKHQLSVIQLASEGQIGRSEIRTLGCRFPVRRESKILPRARGKGVRWPFGHVFTLGEPTFFRLQRMAGVLCDLHGHSNS